MDVLIKNGTIVSAFDEYEADIGITDGKITHIAKNLSLHAKKIVDAKGKFIFPGIIDMHTHIDHWGGNSKTEDDFSTGTKGAAFGGVTTIIDFAIIQGEESVDQAVERRRRDADGKVYIDYSLHAHVTDAKEETLASVKLLIAQGYPSIKMFTTYKKAGFKIEDVDCLNIMKDVSANGGLVMIHAENDSICETLTHRFINEGIATHQNYPKSRPNLAEAECIARMIYFAEQTGARIYIVHVSTKEGVDLIREAKRRGVKVEAETCSHYLLLTEDVYKKEEGYKYIMSPPLRSTQDVQALWDGIKDGTITIVSSDHCAFNVDKKRAGKENFSLVSPGIHGTELMLPLMYEFGVNAGHISKKELVRLLSYHPAKTFGLLGRKGHIGIGYDADIVIFDPFKQRKLTDNNHHMASDFSPYAGLLVNGYPITVISKGKMLIEQEEFVGGACNGSFIKRNV